MISLQGLRQDVGLKLDMRCSTVSADGRSSSHLAGIPSERSCLSRNEISHLFLAAINLGDMGAFSGDSTTGTQAASLG